MKKLFFIIVLLLSVHNLSAQEERKLTRQGNKEFDRGNYAEAEVDYKKALDKKNNFPEAIFNLGDAKYEQKRYDDAAAQFLLSTKTLKDSLQKAKALHNLGNCYLRDNKFQEAVDAYKQSLKLNGKDADTKYNLAFANEKLREQQKQNQQNKNQNQQQDQKNKDKKEQDKKQQEQQQEQKQDKDKKEQQQQGEQPKLSKDQAEKLLNALQNEEQKTQEKMSKKQVKAQEVKIEKDW